MVVHSFYRSTGGEDRYVQQQTALLRSRHDVFLLAKQNRSLRAGVSTAVRMAYSRRIEADVEEVVSSFRPDIIHLHNPYPGFGPAVSLVASKLRVPLVLTVHNHRLRCPNGFMFTADSMCSRCEGGAYFNAVLHPCFADKKQALAYASALWIHRYVLRLEDRIALFVCPSRYMYTRLQAGGIPRERLTLIRNFTPLLASEPAPVGDYGVYVGRLSREKGVHVLLSALAIANDPPFIIVGDGPEFQRLWQLAAKLNLRRTEFRRRLEEAGVDEILRGARFAVVPSLLNENAPLAALEAMARARPLVVSSVGGLGELVDGGGGRIVRPGDAADLALSMEEFMRDPHRSRMAGAAALEFAQNELSPDHHLAQLEEAYRRVARQ